MSLFGLHIRETVRFYTNLVPESSSSLVIGWLPGETMRQTKKR